MNYFLLCLSVAAGLANNCLLRGYAKKYSTDIHSLFAFNAGNSAVWVLILVPWLLWDRPIRIGAVAVLFGCIYGILLGVFLFTKAAALANGPVSLTTLLASMAFVIPIFFGCIVWKETVSLCQIIGIVLLSVSLCLCIRPRRGGFPLTRRWAFFTLGLFLSGGAVGILYKLFGKSSASGEINGMILIAALVSLAVFLIGWRFSGRKREKHLNVEKRKRRFLQPLLFVVAAGAASCFYIRLNVMMSAVIPSAVFFPVVNGSLVIFSTAAGWVLFGERLSAVQLCGIGLGLIGLLVNGCGDRLLAVLADFI